MFKRILFVFVALPMLLNGQISLLSPFGGEIIQRDTDTQINWETNLAGELDIYFSSNGGSNWKKLKLVSMQAWVIWFGLHLISVPTAAR